MADSAERFFVLFLIISSILGEVTSKPSSVYENDEAFPSDRHGCYDPQSQELEELKSRVSAFESIISERAQELLRKEETIQSMERTIQEHSDTISLLRSEIEFMESAGSVKRKGKAEERVYQLEKQIFRLKREAEMQNERKFKLETRTEAAEKKVMELSLKLENERLSKVESTTASSDKKFTEMNWVWLSYKLGSHLSRAQAYLVTQWFEHLCPTLNSAVQKASERMDEVRRWSEPHIKTLNNKWIPNIKDMWLSYAIYLEPKIQSLTDESIKVYHMSKEALTPYLIQALDASYSYVQVAKRHTEPYTSRVMTAAKPHLEKVHVVVEPYAEKVRHGFTKLLDSATIYHQQAQELLKNNELTKPVASVDLAWFVATALLGLPLIFIIKFLSAISNSKTKRSSHKHHHHAINGHRRAKRRHPY